MARVLIDLDGTVCDLITPWLEAYNHRYQDNLKIEDVKGWDLHHYAKKAPEGEVYALIGREGFFRALKPYPGAVEAVKEIAAAHDTLIVTACEYPYGAKEKIEWVRENLPFIPRKNVMIVNRKELVSGDILIDDSPKTAKAFRAAQPGSVVMGIQFPYNAECQDFHFLVPDYADSGAAWQVLKRLVEITVGEK